MKTLCLLFVVFAVSVKAQLPILSGSVSLQNPSASFNPNSLSPVLWVDIDSNKLNHAGSSSPVNNDTIKQWTDCSGNGKDLTQTGGTTVEPVYHTTGGPNNGTRLSFTGAAGMALTNRNTTTFSQPNSFYMVFNDNSGDDCILNCADSQNEQINYSTVSGVHWYSGTDQAIGNRLNLYGRGGWGLVIFEFNGASSTVYTNFFTVVTQNVGTGAMKGMTLGNFFNLGGAATTDFTDLVWFNSVLSAANRTNMINWLATKRGIVLPAH
jgi:hypothetical protein